LSEDRKKHPTYFYIPKLFCRILKLLFHDEILISEFYSGILFQNIIIYFIFFFLNIFFKFQIFIFKMENIFGKLKMYRVEVQKVGAVSCCTPHFFLHPHTVMQRPNYPYYFLKTLKCT